MAKIGLNYGEKLQIADKTYRVITDGLDVPQVLGKLTFRGIEGPDIIFEEDRSQRNPDGSFVQINTGEVRGIVVAIHPSVQHQTLFFTIADMSESEIEDLGLKYREEIELEDIVITHTHVNRNDIFKLFASKIKKKTGGTPSKENKSVEHKKEN